MLVLLAEAARVPMVAAAAADRRCTSRGDARGRPSRVAARGAVRPQDSMERLLAALKLALHDQHAAQMHSPFAPAVGPSWGPV